VEAGGADVAAEDRWGNTPLDEARRVGAAPVWRYLAPLVRRDQALRAAAQRPPPPAPPPAPYRPPPGAVNGLSWADLSTDVDDL
jgi:hypothetical protein